MDDEAIRARLRERERELASEPPLETVATFLSGFCAAAESLEAVRTDLSRIAATHPGSVRRYLDALDSVLAEPSPEGMLAQVVALEANWVLDDPSDAGARAWLEELASLIRDVLDQAGAPPEPR
ncbi:MAG: hypothetical protein ACRDI2_22555 [Chloroflexota bacterium]